MDQDHKDRDKTIDITVNYVGHEPFHEAVHGNPTFHHIKLEAMKTFELEPAAATRYVLQYEGTDLDDQRHVESLGKKKLTLLLMLKAEPVKG